jgi:hypothetical protein
MSADTEIEVPRCPVCLWAVYVRRADGRQSVRLCIGYERARRAELRTQLGLGDTVTVIKFDREDRQTPQNRGGRAK